MTIKDSFLEEAKIGRIVEVVIGPKAIKGEIVLIGQDMMKIKKIDGRTATVMLENISYFEFESVDEEQAGSDNEAERKDVMEIVDAPVDSRKEEASGETEDSIEAVLSKKNRYSEEEEHFSDTAKQDIEKTDINNELAVPFPIKEEFGRIYGFGSQEFTRSIIAFENLKYQETLDMLDVYLKTNNKEEEGKSLREYLEGVIKRLNDETNLENDGSNLYKGIVISKAERNPERAEPYLLKAVEEGGKRLKTAIYRSLILYQVTGENDKAFQMALKLINPTKEVTPEFDQAILWKTMLVIFQGVEDRDNYCKALENLMDCSKEHPVSCVNSILKYVKWLEANENISFVMSIYERALSIGVETATVISDMMAYCLPIYQKQNNNQSIDLYYSKTAYNKYWIAVKDHFAKKEFDIEEMKSIVERLLKETEENTSIEEKGKTTEVQQKKGNLEAKFKRCREEKNFRNTRKLLKELKNKGDSNNEQLMARVDIYLTQHGAYLSTVQTDSKSLYKKALETWMIERNIDEAKHLFISDAKSETESKGKSILACVDMIAVEYGFEESLEFMSEIGPEVKECEREVKVAYHEKKYSNAILVNNIDEALNGLNALRSFYYNKTKLGNTAFRQAECYSQKENWKQARSYYEKAIEYGYLKAKCEQRILICRANLGEIIEENITEEESFESTESIKEIRSRIQKFYNEIQYDKAYNYAGKVYSERPEDEEIRELYKETETILQNYRNSKVTINKSMDNQGYALRAWHIENNIKKAKEFFSKEIETNGPKMVQCIMDCSDMILHSEGIDEALVMLGDVESKIKDLPLSNQSSFYEKMYLMQKKNNNQGQMVHALEQLQIIYNKTNNAKKYDNNAVRLAMVYYQGKEYEKAITTMKSIRPEGRNATAYHRCIALSYAYLGRKEEALDYANSIGNQDGATVELINGIRNQIEEITGLLEDASSQNLKISENTEEIIDIDYMLGYNTKVQDFFIEKYENNPVGEARAAIESGSITEALIKKLESNAPRKWSDRAKYYGTAAVLEKRINDETKNYYRLLAKTSISWGADLRGNGKWDSAMACYIFVLENESKEKGTDVKYTMDYLTCIQKKDVLYKLADENKYNEDISNTFASIMELDVETERNLSAIALLIDKSESMRQVLRNSPDSDKEIWISQISNYVEEDSRCESIEELFSLINQKYLKEKGILTLFENKIKTNKTFNPELLTELREFYKFLYVNDTDKIYLGALYSSFEKGIEIYDYNDYENRMACIKNVETGLNDIITTIQNSPTYFGVNYLIDIVNSLQEIVRNIERKTNEDLKPELKTVVPITDVPIVDGRQNISVTISNKENSASARDVYLSVKDVNGNDLLKEYNVAAYIRGGQTASKEIEINAIEDVYTIRILVTYIDHKDERKEEEFSFSISAGKEAFEPIKNPYFTGDSIDVSRKKLFVGRDTLLDTIESALCDDRSGCEIIYGQKRCGKSSIANFLEDRLKDRFIVIKFSIGAAKSTKSVYMNVKDLVIEKTEDYIGTNEKITEEVLDEIEHRSIGDDEEFISFVRLVHRKLCRPLNKEILLMIDEFTHLYRYVKEDRRQVAAFMDTWKKLLEANLFKAVLIGQDTMPNFIQEFQNQFQVTQPIRVDRLDDESVRHLISDPIQMANGESRFMENSADLIAGWFYGQPYYIQLYCNRLVDQMNSDKKVRVTNALAEKVKNRMLQESEEDLFDNLISKGDESGTEGECYEILKCIAKLTKNSEWASMDDINVENRDDLIQDLLNRSVIRKSENKCKILIPFFKEWLNLN